MKKIKSFHNKLKQNYESGKYDTQYRQVSYYRQLSKLKRSRQAMITNVIILLLLLLVSHFQIVKLMCNSYSWIYDTGLFCFILNCIGFIFSASYYYHLKTAPSKNS